MNLDSNALASLDGRGYVVLEAIAHAGLSSMSTHARPNAFICIDGRTYWLKGNAQQGLVAELIAGRLAKKVGAGPGTRIIRVTHEALPPGGAADHVEGIVVGSEDERETVNARDLQPFVASGQLAPDMVDAPWCFKLGSVLGTRRFSYTSRAVQCPALITETALAQQPPTPHPQSWSRAYRELPTR